MLTVKAHQFHTATMDLITIHYYEYYLTQIWICGHLMQTMYHQISITCSDYLQNCQRARHLPSTTGAGHLPLELDIYHLPRELNIYHLSWTSTSNTEAGHPQPITGPGHLLSVTGAAHPLSTTEVEYVPLYDLPLELFTY